MIELTDSDIITFGKYKGKKLSELPNDYVDWLKNEIEKKSRLRMTLSEKSILKYFNK